MPEDTKKPASAKLAVIVGIDEYKDKKIPTLSGAKNDAEDIFDRLHHPEIGGYAIPEEHVLIGPDATCERIRKALSDVFYKSNESCDMAIFYFSGHGLEDDFQEGYIAPYDMSTEDPLVYGIGMNELKQILSNSVKMGNVKAAIAILDCCYSGIATKGSKVAIAQPKVKFDERVNDFSQPEGVVVLASSGEEETSKELKTADHQDGKPSHPHGLFTSFLIEGLDGNASDEFGSIRLDKLNEYVEKKLREKGKQKPSLSAEKLSGFGTWEIAKSPRIYREKIQSLLGEARESVDKTDPIYLVLAASKIVGVLQVSPNNENARNLRDAIERSMTTYQGKAIEWLGSNELAICEDISEHTMNELNDLAYNCNLEGIFKLKQEQQILLANLWRASTGLLDIKKFILKCKHYDSPRSAPEQGNVKPTQEPPKINQAQKPPGAS